MQAMKESAANMAASAKSGMEKTKATVQEKMEMMSAHNPAEKHMATEKKEERILHAEMNKQGAREHNAAERMAVNTGGSHAHAHTTTGAAGNPMGGHKMSAMPGHSTGEPMAKVMQGTTNAHPIGIARNHPNTHA